MFHFLVLYTIYYYFQFKKKKVYTLNFLIIYLLLSLIVPYHEDMWCTMSANLRLVIQVFHFCVISMKIELLLTLIKLYTYYLMI